MTLTEYFNQENPQRMPYVELQEGEYSLSNFYKYANEERARVFINHPQMGGVEYAVFKNTVNLWATDRDGNPRARSCFHLPLNSTK